MQVVLCPHCDAKIKDTGSHAGQVVNCPRCRGQLQLPHSPQVASGNTIFEDIDEDSGYRLRRRRQQQPSYAAFWTLALVTLLGIGFAGLWLSGVVQFKFPPKRAEQQAKKATANDATSKRQPEKDRSPIPPGKPDAQASGQEKKQQDLAEVTRKKAEEALRDPVSLQVPPSHLAGGKRGDFPEFKQQMRDLATNEFTFRKAQATVYRSAFNQLDQHDGLVANSFFQARNGILDPGSYDFESKRYTFSFFFWYDYFNRWKTIPETTDYCVLRTSIEVDPDTAARMRAAYDKKSLSLTISYRLKRVDERTWAANPHFSGPGRLAYKLAFEVEVLRFDWSPDGR